MTTEQNQHQPGFVAASLTFEAFNIPQLLKDTLTAMEYSVPTPIQAQAIPTALSGKDVIGSAQTGTGKTVAFSLPLVAYLLENPSKNALILAPTRELAEQVKQVLQALTAKTPQIKSALLIGGADMRAQITTLMRRPRIIVGTPGRVIDHLKRGTLMLGQTGFVVLDETDRMLDMGFAPQLDEIQRFLPKEKQTLMFSATYPANIKQMAAKYLREPVRISTGSVSQPISTIKQSVIHTTNHKKHDDLINVITAHVGSIVIFVKTRRDADKVSDQLEALGHQAKAIHGDRSQSQRLRTIDGFRRGKFPILVATDVASRGLDVPQINLVVNYDLPQNPEDYIHRIGRTGRAGAEGSALTLLTNDDTRQWREIVKLMTGDVNSGSGQHIATQSGVVSPEEYAQASKSGSKKPGRSGGYAGAGRGRPQNNSQRAQDYVSNIGSNNGPRAPRSGERSGGGSAGGKEFGERRAPRSNGGGNGGPGAGAGASRRPSAGGAPRKFYGQRTA